MNKHTPGPWEAIGNLVRSPMAKENGSGVMLAECADRWFLKVNSDEAKANARLMAAAPELLEALQTIDKRFKACSKATILSSEAYDAFYQSFVQAAIAKATGEQS